MALSPIFGAKEGVGVIRECLEKKKTMNGLHSAAAHAVVPPPRSCTIARILQEYKN